MQSNTLKLLEVIKKDTDKIILNQSDISGLVDLSDYSNVTILNIRSNRINKIIGLAEKILEIDCSHNLLTNLDNNLPSYLKKNRMF